MKLKASRRTAQSLDRSANAAGQAGQHHKEVTMTESIQVRCPACNRLACEAAPGSLLRVKCGRCGELYERAVAPAR
jgi:Mu-like prophage protein Com